MSAVGDSKYSRVVIHSTPHRGQGAGSQGQTPSGQAHLQGHEQLAIELPDFLRPAKPTSSWTHGFTLAERKEMRRYLGEIIPLKDGNVDVKRINSVVEVLNDPDLPGRTPGQGRVDLPELKGMVQSATTRAMSRQFTLSILGYFTSFAAGGWVGLRMQEDGYTSEQAFWPVQFTIGLGGELITLVGRLAAAEPGYYVQRPNEALYLQALIALSQTFWFGVFHTIVDASGDPEAAKWRLYGSGVAAATLGGLGCAIMRTRTRYLGKIDHVFLNGTLDPTKDAGYSRKHQAGKITGPDGKEISHAAHTERSRLINSVGSLRKSKCAAIMGYGADLLYGIRHTNSSIRAIGARTLCAAAANAARLNKQPFVTNVLLSGWGVWMWATDKARENLPIFGGPILRMPHHEREAQWADRVEAARAEKPGKGPRETKVNRPAESAQATSFSRTFAHSPFSNLPHLSSMASSPSTLRVSPDTLTSSPSVVAPTPQSANHENGDGLDKQEDAD